ncbi:MAG TPA: dihydrofolate reductase [Burkholderiaceae bacterium]|nr:dihydrofolate reductase [Burkholderiaceae bacterium]
MTAPSITLIAARARNGVIGRNNQIPWKIPGEQAYFKKMTMGHPIVMGRKTWESIGRALPGRRNIIVTRDRSFAAPDAEVAGSLDEALALAGGTEVFVIGGAQLYAGAMPRAHRIMLTEIDADFDGDTKMPPLDHGWRETSRDHHAPTSDRPFGYAFVVYER